MEDKKLVRRIMTAVYNIDGTYGQLSRAYGARSNELSLFYALNDGKIHSQKQISEEWCIPKTTLNSIVKDCQEEGLLTLESTGKGREMKICLTEKGRAYAQDFLRPVYEVEAEALHSTVEKYGPEFIEALEHYTEVFEKATAKRKV